MRGRWSSAGSFVAASFVAPAVLAGDAPNELPGPARARGERAAAMNARCEGCHVQVASEWRSSLHRAAFQDPIFQRAFAIEPLPFCQGCHAPEAAPTAAVPASLAQLGVACVTCHVVGNSVLAAPARAAKGRAPHPVLRDARFASTGACASCHEFDFPDAALRRQPERMQATVTEHRASRAAGVPCAGCHMPEEPGTQRRDHRFFVAGNAALLKSSIRVTAERRGKAGLVLHLVRAAAGHAVPTGDLFRRLEVSAELVGRDWQVLDRQVRYLARHFGETVGRAGVVIRTVVRDDRVGAAGASEVRSVVFSFASPHATGVSWRVAYQRVEHPRSDTEESALVADETTLASGYLPLVPEKHP